MRTQRRFFVAILPVLLAATRPPAATPQARVPEISVERLTDHSWLIRDGLGSGNVLLYDHPAGAYLIDAGAPESAAAIVRTVDSLTSQPVQTVISTHYHADHIGANPIFRRRGARVLGHDRLAEEAARDTTIPELRWERKPADPEAMPTVRIAKPALILDGEGESIVAIERLRNGHTRTDLLVLLPTESLIHVGDLVEVGAYPFIDWWAGGSLDGMIEDVELLLDFVGEDDRIVPGHGDLIGRGGLRSYLEMLVTVRDRARDAIGRGGDREAFLGSRPTREFDAARGGEEAGRRFASLVWVGLTAAAAE
jgi:glyoxylase-like metal-dependent hydrolase (beta-lactamase superfamily II)